MRRWILTGTLSWTLAAAAMAASGPLSLAKIKQQYAGMRGFHAEAEQIKTSPLLLRPLTTLVSMSLDKGLLTWQPKGQTPWQIRFNDRGPPTFIQADPSLAAMPAAAKTKLTHTLNLMHALMTFGPELERDFQLTIQGDALLVVPRQAGGSLFFTKVLVSFTPDQHLQSMTFYGNDDETKIHFLSLKIDPA